jgi:hypothetical protein
LIGFVSALPIRRLGRLQVVVAFLEQTGVSVD